MHSAAGAFISALSNIQMLHLSESNWLKRKIALMQYEPGIGAQVKDVLSTGALSVKQLQLKEGQAWKLFLDIYVLDADGCILDVCLLAAVAALLGLRLPSAEIDEDGKVCRSPTQQSYQPFPEGLSCDSAVIHLHHMPHLSGKPPWPSRKKWISINTHLLCDQAVVCQSR